MKKMAVSTVVAIATLAFLAAGLTAQNKNPRFGKWKLKSEAPPPSSNIMTYEPHGAKGPRTQNSRDSSSPRVVGPALRFRDHVGVG